MVQCECRAQWSMMRLMGWDMFCLAQPQNAKIVPGLVVSAKSDFKLPSSALTDSVKSWTNSEIQGMKELRLYLMVDGYWS